MESANGKPTLFCWVAIAFLLMAPSTGAAQESEEIIPFEILAAQYYSGHTDKQNYVITTRREWKRIWALAHSGLSKPPLPEIDFSQHMVIAIFRGFHGYAQPAPTPVVKKANGSLKIVIKERLPIGFYCPSLPHVTYPSIMIRTPKLRKKLIRNAEFVLEQEINDCQPRQDTVVIEQLDPSQWNRDQLAVREAVITGDVMKVKVSHGSGCKFHQFQLVASRAFLESNPVQTGVLLAYEANNNSCEALVTRELLFDLTPLKIAYQQAYQVVSGVILLRLHETDIVLRYEFDS